LNGSHVEKPVTDAEVAAWNAAHAPKPEVEVAPGTDAPVAPGTDAPPVVDLTEARYAAVGRAVTVIAEHLGDSLIGSLARALERPQFAHCIAEVVRHVGQALSAPAGTEDPNAGALRDALAELQQQAREQAQEKLPRILVAGLKPNQIEELRTEYAERARLVFWKQTDSAHLLKSQMPGVQAAVAMVGKMGHVTDAALAQGMKSRSRAYVRVSGGVSSVKKGVERAIKMLALESAGHFVAH